MFNTGDIARWRVDGSLDMLGRKDDQVKIKVNLFRQLRTLDLNAKQGFRVELDGVTKVIEVRHCSISYNADVLNE